MSKMATPATMLLVEGVVLQTLVEQEVLEVLERPLELRQEVIL